MQSATKEIDEKFKNNDNLPLVFADIIRVSQRNDGMCLLQFAAATPSTGFTEQTRVIVPGNAIKGLIQILGNMDAKDPLSGKTKL